MINYKIGDLVNRINTMCTKLNGGPHHQQTSLGLEVPYTKDNYQIICQLIKLGILQDTKIEHPLAGDNKFGVCRVMISPSHHPKSSLEGQTGLVAPQGQNNLNQTNIGSLAPKVKYILKLVSKPGRKVYISYKDLKDLNNGFKVYMLRTSQGIITSQTAFKYKIGGEVLFKISI